MSSSEIKFEINNFSGGINLGIDESQLKVNESANAENINISNSILETCNGIENYSKDILKNIKSIMIYYRKNIPMIIVSANGCLYKYQDNRYNLIASGFQSDEWDYVNYRMFGEDVIILTNGVDNVKVYNGVFRDLKRDGNGSDPNVTENKAPKGKYVEVYNERLFICADNYIYISKDFDFDDFTTPVDADGIETNNHGAVIENYTVDGSNAIGMKMIFDEMIIFKERSIYKIYGTSPSSYQKALLFNTTGAIADKSIAVDTKGAYFLSDNSIYVYDGVNCTLISDKISNIFKDFNKEKISNSCATIFNNKLILAVPYKTSDKNNFVIEYDLINKNFVFKTGFTVNNFAKIDDLLLLINDNSIYKYNTNKTYDGANIKMFYETPYSNFGYPNAIKEVGDCYITCQGTGKFKISCVSEKKAKFKIIDLSEQEKVIRVNLNNKGRLVKFKFENVDGSMVKIKGFKTIFELDED